VFGGTCADEDIGLMLLENLLALHQNLITAFKTMLMKELMMKYITTHLMHEMLKSKEKES
jgi:hypothetical protein